MDNGGYMTTQEGKESENQIMSEGKVRIAELYVSRDVGGKEFDECDEILLSRHIAAHLRSLMGSGIEDLKANRVIEAYLTFRNVSDLLYEISIHNRRVLPMVTEWR